MQPVGHLCDLLGIPRFAPGVFDAMVDLLYEEGGDDSTRDARLASLGRRLTGGR
jgi:hypothetical protein